MKEIFKETLKQIVPVFAAAFIAAALAFGQALASQAGLCPAPVASPAEVGYVGATLKAVHSVLARVFG